MPTCWERETRLLLHQLQNTTKKEATTNTTPRTTTTDFQQEQTIQTNPYTSEERYFTKASTSCLIRCGSEGDQSHVAGSTKK
jgi:hypothetical protein